MQACSKFCLNAAVKAACGCATIFNAAIKVDDGSLKLCNLSNPTLSKPAIVPFTGSFELRAFFSLNFEIDYTGSCVDSQIIDFKRAASTTKAHAGPGCLNCFPSCRYSSITGQLFCTLISTLVLRVVHMALIYF